eukprot:m.432390 g.432390  ORF g.432390 m.432390 type:complete len:73 (+) comp17427_c0_seq1:3380-3598(+)
MGGGDADAKASKEQMSAAKVPVAWRDSCAGLLITLNECRKKQWYMPWACEHERHDYEVCQYKEYLTRLKSTK